jgi:hypothetical protein
MTPMGPESFAKNLMLLSSDFSSPFDTWVLTQGLRLLPIQSEAKASHSYGILLSEA